MTAATTDVATLPDPPELESLVLNVNASLRIETRQQFSSWTRESLQKTLRHELLFCALWSGDPLLREVDVFAAPTLEFEGFGEMLSQDAAVVPHFMEKWENNSFRPVAGEVRSDTRLAQTKVGRELSRVGASLVLAHGTYDTSGKTASFFAFACKPETVGTQQAHLSELVVPFLHLAWVRTRIGRAVLAQGTAAAGNSSLLTSRETEILRWIHFGKSNIEIGAILEISPLTVKNHVQKILRKLNVQNRAQAVGRGLALRILSL